MNTDKIYAESIVNEYSVKSDSKVVALRKLDKKVKGFPLALALAIGIISTLVLGTGMCLVMGVIGSGTRGAFVLGIVIGIIGIVGVSVNYPIYKRVLGNRREKYAGDIIRLASDIAKES